MIQRLLRLALLVYYVAVDAVQIYMGYEGGRMAGLFLTAMLAIIVFLLLLNRNLNLSTRVMILHLYLFALITYCFINSLMATYPQSALSRTEQLAKYCLTAAVFFIAYDHDGAVDEMLHLVMYGGFILVLLYVYQYGFDYIVNSLAASERITSERINSNTIGMSAAYSCLIFLFYWLSGTLEPVGLPLALLSLIIIFASQSRKAIFILILGIALHFLLGKRRKMPSIRYILVSVGIVLIVAFLNSRFDLSAVTDRIVGLTNSLTGRGYIDKSTLMRRNFISVGMRLFREHPLFGVGVDCSKYYTTFLYGYNYHLHNNYVELLADMGIIGLVLYYWIYVYMLVRMFRGHTIATPQERLCMIMLIIRLVMDYGFYAYKEQGTYLILVLFFVCFDRHTRGSGAETLALNSQGPQVATSQWFHAGRAQ